LKSSSLLCRGFLILGRLKPTGVDGIELSIEFL